METDCTEGTDEEFEVTAEMMIHETMDDETTLAVEEALQTEEEDVEELSELLQEGHMPLEQLLCLYGYGTQSSDSSSPKAHVGPNSTSNLSQFESSIRSRRKRERGTEVFLLGNVRELSAMTSSPHPPPLCISSLPQLSCSSLAPSMTQFKGTCSEVFLASGDVGGGDGMCESDNQRKVHPVLSNRVPILNLSHDVTMVPEGIVTLGSNGSSSEELKRSGGQVKQECMHFNHNAYVLLQEEKEFSGPEVKQDACTWSEMEQDDTTDVEVVEDDGVTLEVGLGERDEGLLQLAEMEREGLYVVRMDDIEAGLSKGEQLLSPLDMMKKEDCIRGYGMQMDSDGLGVEDVERVEDVVEGEAEEKELEEERLEEEIRGLAEGAVYEDVMLSSSSNSRLLSDSSDEFHPAPSAPSPSSLPSSDVGKSYVRGTRLRSEIPERRSMRLMNNDDRALLTAYIASVLSDASGSESDEEYSPQVDWRKEVKVGIEYQACIPDYVPVVPYPSSSNSLNKLVWTPRGITEDEVSAYLGSLSEFMDKMLSDPCHHDHELALEVLSNNNHNAPRALKAMQVNNSQHGMSPWTEDETKAFEDGLRSVGKDFFLLHRKVPSRTVKELVEFYYLWKKTERHDHFIQTHGKIGRKKIIVSPGHVSDFMDKYLDMHNSDAIDVHYLTTTVAAEAKKENS